MSCRVVPGGQLSDNFDVKTGVRQGCLLSLFLFALVVDRIMRTSTDGRRNSIQWTGWSQFGILDFADDLAVLSHSRAQIQDKTTCLKSTSANIDPHIDNGKAKITRMQHASNGSVTVAGQPLEEVNSFTYLRNTVDIQGWTDADVHEEQAKHKLLS